MPLILISIFSVWFATLSRIPQYVSDVLFNFGIKKEVAPGMHIPIRLLPFDCDKCLSFWLGLLVAYQNSPLWMALILAGCTSLLAIFINRVLIKLQ